MLGAYAVTGNTDQSAILMTTGVGGDESWGEGSREEDVQLNDDDLFEEYHPPELKNAGEDPPSEGINGEATNEYPQVRLAC